MSTAALCRLISSLFCWPFLDRAFCFRLFCSSVFFGIRLRGIDSRSSLGFTLGGLAGFLALLPDMVGLHLRPVRAAGDDFLRFAGAYFARERVRKYPELQPFTAIAEVVSLPAGLGNIELEALSLQSKLAVECFNLPGVEFVRVFKFCSDLHEQFSVRCSRTFQNFTSNAISSLQLVAAYDPLLIQHLRGEL